MLIRIRTLADIPSSAITPEGVYRSRREFIRAAAAGAVGAVAGPLVAGCDPAAGAAGQAPLPNVKKSAWTVPDPVNTFEQITTYNNFYEFGTNKNDPARYADRLTVKPWSVRVDGLVKKPGTYGVEDLVDFTRLEERVYRMRCVEAWSMVIPWVGVSLADVLAKVEPEPRAKYVAFETLVRPAEMPGQRSSVLEWPYVEGLRLDEAMHPLAMMVVGLYGRVLPNQNGAPLRLVVPWKYGFKGIKSIVRLRLTESQPKTSWSEQAPHEYGFYANVNPTVDHPRWSQARERRLPEFSKGTPTLMFNGYADQVASLYQGMDLRKFY